MSESTQDTRHPLEKLRDPGTVRARCRAVLRAVDSNVSEHFRLDRGALPAVAERVAALTLQRFPDLRIPYHSRWRHFEAGGVDRKPVLDALLATASLAEAARTRFDLTVVSVLLDAGAGPDWKYTEDGGGVYVRSEGLGVASWHAFLRGVFSSSAAEPLRADAAALEKVDSAALRSVFQASPSNPMVGLEGRAGLLQRLGAALRKEGGAGARPALLFDRLTRHGMATETSATQILGELLRTLGPIWTSGSQVQGLPAGDVWPHRWAGAACGDGSEDPTTAGWVPFHKLSQWLSYSLLEPLQWAGIGVTGLDALSGLPEYRNGGLLLDAGVLVPRDPRSLAKTWKPKDDFIIEWRACTVALLDEVAVLVRQRLGRSAEELPLACILEGGTWAAGRQIAGEKRPGGVPPLKIDSDGTVF
ncbi:MAG: URC4/urg3 family protein [Rubrivivax sp.]|nr:URC4/urg3 family protein [Rubrivivax sp.]